MLKDFKNLIIFLSNSSFGNFKYLVNLDNIVIYGKTIKDNRLYGGQIFECLKDFRIQANINNCKFLIQKTKFLDRIISTISIQINLLKVNTKLD